MNKTSWFDTLVLVMVVLTILAAPTQYSLEMTLGSGHAASKFGLSPGEAMLALTAIVWGIGVLVRKQLRSLRWPPVAAWVFVALCIPSVFLAGVGSLTMKRGLVEIAQYVAYFLVAYMVFVNTLATPRVRSAALSALLLGLMANLYFAYRTYSTEPWSDTLPVQVAGLLGNRNVFGMYLCVLVPLAGALVLLANELWLKIVAFVLLAWAMVVILAGGPFLGVLLALGVLVAWRGFRTLAVYLLLVLALVLFVLPNMRYDNRNILARSLYMYNEAGGDEDHRVEKRYLEWQAALKALDPGQQPYTSRMDYYRKVLLGNGVGMYEKEIERFWERMPRPNEDIMEHDTHNQYVILAISAGFPAALAFIWLLATYGFHARRSLAGASDDLDQAIAFGAVGALVAVAIAGLFAPVILRGVGLVLVALMALAAAPSARKAER